MSEVENRHRHLFLRQAGPDQVFRVVFRDGEVFHLRQFSEIDSSIYGLPDGWCAEIVKFENPRSEHHKKLLRAGSGLDFYESDIVEITDVARGVTVFPS